MDDSAVLLYFSRVPTSVISCTSYSYCLTGVALPLGATGREEVGLPWSLCWAVDGGQVFFFLDVVASSHSKWLRIGHGEVETEFLRRNCWA